MVFDSDILIWFLRREPNAIEFVDDTTDRAVSIMTQMEAIQGARSKAEARVIHSLLRDEGFRILPLSEAIGHTAAALIDEFALSNGLHAEDALIAATAIESGEVLATANHKHFSPIRRLAIKNFRPRGSTRRLR
jgi:predicted nucleic acid-binding protein